MKFRNIKQAVAVLALLVASDEVACTAMDSQTDADADMPFLLFQRRRSPFEFPMR